MSRALASRQLEISTLLQSFRPLREKLNELMDCETAAIETLTGDAVHVADLEDLNKHILQKRALHRVFQMVEELKEDLHPGEESSDQDEK